MTPGQAMGGNPRTQATQTAIFMPPGIPWWVEDMIPHYHIPTISQETEGAFFSPRWKCQISFWGLWFGDPLRGHSSETSGSNTEGGREKAGERGGERATWRPRGMVRLVFTFCHSLEYHRAQKEFPRTSKFEEIKV